ncbi:hypothetical protein SAMN04487895_11718 [Paenibacillus sophorae]|uniref:Uncharacterized protein n=1 Tax=Paenibacillus sophorae TaxID=1333845 RepID=A0A1H8UCU4_9BACL|nr:DUF6075 family protein [Paenibacillus sophorae]QWU13199.1 hypothetical protein KP014_14335 [Paenibacillus sophorae]SEP00683.1 hypothetical protein SAMN04487895_11718 [Paenibacillus sophorae]
MHTKFKDLEHHQFYEGMIRMTHSQTDTYRQALFYLLGLTEQTRSHVRDLYDFDENSICLEGLYKGWQTSSTVKLTRLAFNLYNGYSGDEERDASRNYSPYFMFDTGLLPYFFEAVKLHYPEFAQVRSHDFVQLPFGAMKNHEEYDLEH